MGIFHVNIEVSSLDGKSKRQVRSVMVDSGSEFSWIPEDALREIDIDVRKKDQPFIMANGQTITRDIGYAIIRSGEFETIDEVVFGRKGDCKLLGARTLEGFNASVDAGRKRLVAAGPAPVAANR